ncbi:hypothetical protein FRC07_004382, partial [Ceratobasidium sp. 392]
MVHNTRFNPIPIPAVAMVLTIMEHGIKEWKTRRFIPRQLNAAKQATVYQSQLAGLLEYAKPAAKRLAKFWSDWFWYSRTIEGENDKSHAITQADQVRLDTPPVPVRSANPESGEIDGHFNVAAEAQEIPLLADSDLADYDTEDEDEDEDINMEGIIPDQDFTNYPVYTGSKHMHTAGPSTAGAQAMTGGQTWFTASRPTDLLANTSDKDVRQLLSGLDKLHFSDLAPMSGSFGTGIESSTYDLNAWEPFAMDQLNMAVLPGIQAPWC